MSRDAVLTAAEMRKLETDAIMSGRVSGAELMACAGERAVAETLSLWPDLQDTISRAVILCGPGNNGGDGYVMAGILAGRGWQVDVFALGAPTRLPPDARANRDLWAAECPVRPLADAAHAMASADLIVDALFGIGLARPLDADVVRVLKAVPTSTHRMSVDVPSGYDTDTGTILGDIAFPADLTVTFHSRKPVHSVLESSGCVVRVVDIGL
ncbi:NAD(P)H-hydrate epimerase [Rhodobacteraceae bacterium SC52]|nr:NAD(P)H-hydrate epimerase [Rhodobacteraceae bacterium SC52]